MAGEMYQFNRQFDRSRFVDACGVDLTQEVGSVDKKPEKWEYPEELARLEEEPHTIRRWTEEEAAHAAIGAELRRQHETIMAILDQLESDGADCGA